jgi:hypothetical protein
VEPLAEHRTRLTIAVDFEGHGIGKVLVPLVVRREARKEMPANLAASNGRSNSNRTTVDLPNTASWFDGLPGTVSWLGAWSVAG